MTQTDKSNKPRQSKDSGKRPAKSKAESKHPVTSKVDSKPYHKEQLKAATESMYKYPYLNLSLVDMDGEVWKPFPVAPFDTHFVVSNKGRVKRLEYTIERSNGSFTTLPELIIKQTTIYYYNRHLNEKIYSLSCKATSEKIRRGFPVARMIYHAFVDPFDLEDSYLFVRHKDGNGFNNLPENLYLFHRSKMSRWLLDNGRRDFLSGATDRAKYSQEVIQGWNDSLKKKISQYDLGGCLVKTFNSCREAAETLGVKSSSFTRVLRGEKHTVGGYLWREGIDPPSRINVPRIKYKIRVAQYNLEGDLIRIFPTIKEAAKNVGVTSGVVADRLYGRSAQKGTILKEVAQFKEPPAKITVEQKSTIKKIDNEKYGIPKGRNYPFLNLSLEDMPGEEWKVIPDTDGICWMSNFGRFKTVDRLIKFTTGGSFIQKGQIISQTIRKNNTDRPMLHVRFKIKKRMITCQIPNLVYRLFRGEISLRHAIRFKDNDSLNCKIENLTIESTSSIRKKYIQEGRLSGEKSNKIVAQYTPEGKHIATFSSIKEVCEKNGFNRSSIWGCATSKKKLYKGFIWKYIKPDEEVPQQIEPDRD